MTVTPTSTGVKGGKRKTRDGETGDTTGDVPVVTKRPKKSVLGTPYVWDERDNNHDILAMME